MIEDAVNHLYGVDESGANSLDSILRFPTVQAQPEVADDAITFQFFKRLAGIGLIGPFIRPDVELQQIDVMGSQLGKAGQRSFLGGIFEATKSRLPFLLAII